MNNPSTLELIGRITEAFLPDLWRALPAAVLALLAFGFRRMARRFLGLFERMELISHKVDEHLTEARAGFQANDETHKSIINMVDGHCRRSAEDMARIERAIEAQARRIDDLVGRKS